MECFKVGLKTQAGLEFPVGHPRYVVLCLSYVNKRKKVTKRKGGGVSPSPSTFLEEPEVKR